MQSNSFNQSNQSSNVLDSVLICGIESSMSHNPFSLTGNDLAIKKIVGNYRKKKKKDKRSHTKSGERAR